MPPKKRNPENDPLPKGWRYKNGAYRYRVPKHLQHLWNNKSEFKLGKTLAEAYRTWAERLELDASEIRTFEQLADRYSLETIPEKAPKTQESNLISVRKLRPVFGMMHPNQIEPIHAYKYYDLASKKHGKTAARHDIQVLRHMLTKAVEWGVIRMNQLIGQVRIEKPSARDRLVEPWEIASILSLKNKGGRDTVYICQLYVKLKLMTGLRRGDILRLVLSDIKEDGIHVQPSKTQNSSGKRLIIEWDEPGEMRALVNEILKIPPLRIGDAPLFVTRQGKHYIDDKGKANAFDSLWQRFVKKVMDQTNIAERFQERDLRAATGSYSDSLIEASERLGHASTETTQRIYRRRPVRVQPLIMDALKMSQTDN